LQRAGVHELDEARGYAALIELQPDTYTDETLAEKIGRSEKYVYARLRLTHLVEEVQQAFYADRGRRSYLSNLKLFFGDRKLENITVGLVEGYRDQRRQQPARNRPGQTVKGATVNRELECLKCMLDFAVKRKYLAENPAAQVKHFNELRERPTRRMLTLDEERRILDVAPDYLPAVARTSVNTRWPPCLPARTFLAASGLERNRLKARVVIYYNHQ
jgi:Phage integrase SAM-like domain